MPQIRFDMPRRDCRLTCLLESRLGTPSSFSSCGRAQSHSPRCTRAASLCQSRLQRVQRVTYDVPEGYLVHYAARPEARHHYSANSNPPVFSENQSLDNICYHHATRAPCHAAHTGPYRNLIFGSAYKEDLLQSTLLGPSGRSSPWSRL